MATEALTAVTSARRPATATKQQQQQQNDKRFDIETRQGGGLDQSAQNAEIALVFRRNGRSRNSEAGALVMITGIGQSVAAPRSGTVQTWREHTFCRSILPGGWENPRLIRAELPCLGHARRDRASDIFDAALRLISISVYFSPAVSAVTHAPSPMATANTTAHIQSTLSALLCLHPTTPSTHRSSVGSKTVLNKAATQIASPWPHPSSAVDQHRSTRPGYRPYQKHARDRTSEDAFKFQQALDLLDGPLAPSQVCCFIFVGELIIIVGGRLYSGHSQALSTKHFRSKLLSIARPHI
jgi:hypothetical protein